MFHRFFLVVTLLSTLLVGCAGHELKRLPRIDSLAPATEFQKPSVHFTVSGTHGSSENTVLGKNESYEQEVTKLVAKHAEASGYFSSVSVNRESDANADVKISVEVHNHFNRYTTIAAGYLTGATFGVIPSWSTDNYNLKFSATNSNGKTKEYSNSDASQVRIGWVFLPFMGVSITDARKNTFENQVLDGLNSLHEAGIFTK